MLQSPVVQSVEAAKWARALDRALAEALDVLIEPISGEAFVESATRPGTLYAVSATSCNCPAGQQGIPCKHRACYLAQIGELPLGAPPAQIRHRCPFCIAGKVEMWVAGHVAGSRPCEACGGTGVDTDLRPHEAPEVRPLAA
jgi:hypothetical protein